MNKINTYKEFLNENNISETEMDYLLDKIISLPNNEIMEFKHDIENMIELDESLNEGLSSWVNDMKSKFSRWLDDKLFKFLINRKKDFYIELVEKLDLFDLTTLDDVIEAFPGLKIKSMYLAGGMDDAEDVGAGWRNTLTYEFEVVHKGNPKGIVDPIVVGKTPIENPSYTVNGDWLDLILKDPSQLDKHYDRPQLFDPVRKEVDREKDVEFAKSLDILKEPGYLSSNTDRKDNVKAFNYFRKTFTKNIEPDDEHLLRICSAVFLGMDSAAGAGTYGELQLLSMIRKPLFIWLINSHIESPGQIKIWNIPHASKIARNEDEMKILVSTIMKYTR